MNEHIFPLEADTDLRQQVTLEIERDKAESQFIKMKKMFYKFILKAILSLLVMFVGYWRLFPQMSWGSLLGYWISLIIVVNVPELIFLWRETKESKQHLKSWEAVKKDYEAVKEQQ
ncbi:MAG: hypothetical protein AB1757_25975 [Acidobacteriota bacterium]